MAARFMVETQGRWIEMAGAGAARQSGPLTAEDIAAGRMTPALIMAATVSAIASLLYGYDTGIISGALLQIGHQFHIGTGWESVIAASILLGAIIGALSWQPSLGGAGAQTHPADHFAHLRGGDAGVLTVADAAAAFAVSDRSRVRRRRRDADRSDVRR